MVLPLADTETQALKRLLSEPGWMVLVRLIQDRARMLEAHLQPLASEAERVDAWGQRRALLQLVTDLYTTIGVRNPYSQGIVPLWQHTEQPPQAAVDETQRPTPPRPVRSGGGLVG